MTAAADPVASHVAHDVDPRQRHIGARLRRVRAQQGLSLAQVEQRSEGRWKAVVVGAYERGDRAVTIGRLAGLASFYGVPVAVLVPDPSPTAGLPEPAPDAGLLLDVDRLLVHRDDDGPVGAVARFAARIRDVRGDHGGDVLTLREDDVDTLAVAAGVEVDVLHRELVALGLRLDLR